MSKETLEFGSGSFVGPVLNDPTFYELPVRDQAQIIGWANGCPVVDELTDPQNTEPGRGPENMLGRYGKVNFWFGYIARSVGEQNPDLYEQLMTPVERLSSEPVGEYEAGSVPPSYQTHMAPMGTIAGYALPRIFTKQLGEGLPFEESQDRLSRGLHALDQAIPKAKTPAQLLALVAEGLSQADVDPLTALSNTLSVGWLKEHNALTMLAEAKKALEENAPTLWSAYSQLSDGEKALHNIA